jgi:hypothetical protein
MCCYNIFVVNGLDGNPPEYVIETTGKLAGGKYSSVGV